MNLNLGKIIINNNEIFSGMNSGDFLSIFSSEVNSFGNGDIERYHFIQPQIIGGLSFWIKIVFKKKHISSIELKNADPKLKNSYDNWSDDRIVLKRKSHDEWLITTLGQPTERKPSGIKYNYAWGEILSYYDLKGGDTGIVINYYEKVATD
ncbi:hypothetical protein P6709_06830 [Jeotgalibacillus sp. ET6]|uniref:hypothetical protein n=1 Tax=Jeotgalibacillus sp. ET6 TaxID=3037260 RepID=UPI002418A2CE|nr:hypothetical protein [Jeotgalibacillus sp. ET6]MDG5471456.1 hypothetical protein [Jeotgalibacillus sp. ET6]